MGGGSTAEGDPLLESGTTEGAEGSNSKKMMRASWGGAGGIIVVENEGALMTMAPFWWVFLLRGLIMVMFGMFVIFYPEVTLLFLTVIFGAFMFADGVACFVNICAYQRYFRENQFGNLPPVLYFLNACCDVAIGVFTFAHPDVTATILLIFVTAWFLATGLLEILLACTMRGEIRDGAEWGLGIGGLVSFLFGVLLLKDPEAGVITFTTLIGIVTIFLGCQVMYVGTNLKTLNTMIRLSQGGESTPVNLAINVV